MIIALALLAAASLPTTTRPLSPAERRIVEGAVREGLIDPDSATFKPASLVKGSDRYCSVVNSKNRMGGYTGYGFFAVMIQRDTAGHIVGGQMAPALLADDGFKRLMEWAHCDKAGYKVPRPPVE